MNVIKRAAACFIVAATLAGGAVGVASVNQHHASTSHHAVVLKPCRTEDDVRNCYWDAKHRGNHKGTSFVMLGGHLYRDQGAVR